MLYFHFKFWTDRQPTVKQYVPVFIDMEALKEHPFSLHDFWNTNWSYVYDQTTLTSFDMKTNDQSSVKRGLNAFAKSIDSWQPMQSTQADMGKKLSWSHIFFIFNFSTNKPLFSRVCSTSILKRLGEKEKLLVMSNFSFSHSVFYLFEKLSSFSSNSKLSSANSFSLEEPKVWERLKDHSTWWFSWMFDKKGYNGCKPAPPPTTAWLKCLNVCCNQLLQFSHTFSNICLLKKYSRWY